MKNALPPLLTIGIYSLAFTSCAFGPGIGMLAKIGGTYNLDPGQLKRNCDMEDSGACLLSGKPDAGHLKRVPILQGFAPTGSAIFSAQLPVDFQGQWFSLHRPSQELKPLMVMEKYPSAHKIRMEIIEASQLQGKENYELILVDHLGQVVDHRTFKTFEANRESLKFAALSCLDDSFEPEQKRQWLDVRERQPDILFLLGDNVYLHKKSTLDSPLSRDDIWQRYVETRKKLDFFYWRELVPVVATWDDNDYGGDDATNPSKDASRWVHEVYFPVKADTKLARVGPGTAKAIFIANQSFVFLDNRSFRTKNSRPSYCKQYPKHIHCQKRYAKDSEDASHFGKMQEEWVVRILKENQPAWLISGDQWFGDYHPFESFEGNHQVNFRKFLTHLEFQVRKKSVPFVFLSGDRHLAEVMKVSINKRTTYEFTSSGIHAKTYPDSWREFPNPRKLIGFSGLVNYMMFETKKTPSGDLDIQLDIRSMGQSLSKKSFLVRKK